MRIVTMPVSSTDTVDSVVQRAIRLADSDRVKVAFTYRDVDMIISPDSDQGREASRLTRRIIKKGR